MKPGRYTRGRFLTAAASLLLVLGACEDDPAGIENPPDDPEVVSLDEIYEVDRENEVQYGAAPDETATEQALLLDLYLPRDDSDGLRPAVIVLHGGGFTMGHKGEMTEYARRIASRGYVTASANYRLREGGTFDYTDPEDELGKEAKHDAQHDVQAAVRWLRANAETYRIDVERIYLVGYSAGGTAALRASAYPDDPGASGTPDQSSEVAAVVAISGYLDEGVLEAAGPSLMIHGDADTKVPLADISGPCDALESCQLVTIAGGVHAMVNSNREQILPEISTYLHARATGS